VIFTVIAVAGVPVNVMTKNCPTDSAPSLVAREYGDVVSVIDEVPLTNLSIRSKLVLAMSPHVPEYSPVAGFDRPPLFV
jgi:hypothetical protein